MRQNQSIRDLRHESYPRELCWLCTKPSINFLLSPIVALTQMDKMGAILGDNLFKCIFANEKFCILIRISLKFIAEGPVDNNPALV